MSIYYWFVGHKMRINYWSGSKFAAWIRNRFGLEKQPKSATMTRWSEWKATNKSINSIAYWVTETGLNKLQDLCYFPYDTYRNLRGYLRNRFVDKPHYIDTKLSRGEWHEIDDRLVCGIFELIVDFVEIEKAHMYDISHDDQMTNQEKGLAYLDWEIGLGSDKEQSKVASEIKKIYLWWKIERPARPDPHEVSGWNDYCIDHFGTNERDQPKISNMLRKVSTLEARYDAEDEQMLIRVIKIRKGLWT